MFFLLRLQIKNKEKLSYKLTEGVKEDGLILHRTPGELSASQWQIEGSKFKQSLFLLLRYGAQVKGDAVGPPRAALTLTIKEQTISVKHVFSAFTLYANVLRRVKVPFDKAQ